MMIVLIVCGVVAMILPWVFFGKTKGVLEEICLIAQEKGETVSAFYGCRGCFQHLEFGKKYAPELLTKIWIYDIGGAIAFFVPVVIALIIFSKIN